MIDERAKRIERLLAFQAVQLHQLDMAINSMLMVLTPQREKRTSRFRQLQREILKTMEENQKTLVDFLKELSEDEEESEQLQHLMLLVESMRRPIGFSPPAPRRKR